MFSVHPFTFIFLSNSLPTLFFFYMARSYFMFSYRELYDTTRRRYPRIWLHCLDLIP